MEIEIVSCENTKMKVKIHDGLLKANTSHSKAEQALQGEIISNPFNQELKAKYCELIPFIK